MIKKAWKSYLQADQGSKEDTTEKDGPLQDTKVKRKDNKTAGTALSNSKPKRVSHPKVCKL